MFVDNFVADLEQHGAEKTVPKDSGRISVSTQLDWQTLQQRCDYEYTRIDSGGGQTARLNKYVVEPIDL